MSVGGPLTVHSLTLQRACSSCPILGVGAVTAVTLALVAPVSLTANALMCALSIAWQ